jgi:hypothetical protein
MLFLLSQFYRVTSAVIASELMHDLSLTAEDMGLLSSIFFYAFALIQIPMGAAIDIFGARRLISFLSSLGIVGALVFALSGSLSSALIGRALIGIGMACALMGTFKLISVWFSPYSFTTISGIILSIGTFGNVLATAPLAVAVNSIGWRKTFILIALIHLFITISVYVIVKDHPDKSMGKDISLIDKGNWLKESVEGVMTVVRLPSFWLIAISAFVRYGTYVSIAGLWAGPYLEHVYQIPLVDRGKILNAMKRIDSVLGVMDLTPKKADKEVEVLIARREAARQNRDWDTADRLRQQLKDMEIEVIDTKEGPITVGRFARWGFARGLSLLRRPRRCVGVPFRCAAASAGFHFPVFRPGRGGPPALAKPPGDRRTDRLRRSPRHG